MLKSKWVLFVLFIAAQMLSFAIGLICRPVLEKIVAPDVKRVVVHSSQVKSDVDWANPTDLPKDDKVEISGPEILPDPAEGPTYQYQWAGKVKVTVRTVDAETGKEKASGSVSAKVDRDGRIVIDRPMSMANKSAAVMFGWTKVDKLVLRHFGSKAHLTVHFNNYEPISYGAPMFGAFPSTTTATFYNTKRGELYDVVIERIDVPVMKKAMPSDLPP